MGEPDAIKIVHWALDNGVNFIDTANMYEGYTRFIGSPGGVAEEILGKALKGRREQAVLATKVGNRVGDAPEDEGLSPAAVKKNLDLSLKRLAMDFVDIYYLHSPDENTPVVDSIRAMGEAIQAGKVRHYAISNYSAEQTAELLKAADENNLPRPVLHQGPYSLLLRDLEKDLFPLCEREQIGVVPYQVLQGGLLTGKYRRGQSLPADSRKAEKDGWVWELTDELLDQLEAIGADARARGRTMTQQAIAACFDRPAVTSIIVGVKRIDQLQAAVEAVSWD